MIFADLLIRFAAQVPDPRVTAIAERLAEPLRVAVEGRRGVGRRTVARALRRAGATVTVQPAADVVAYVVAEVVKPEDIAVVAALEQPVVVLLNKSDLPGGANAAEVSARIGAPAEPIAARFAVAAQPDRPDGIAAAMRRVNAAGAAVRYRRLLDAVADLEALGVGDERITGFLSGDDAVAARLAAAVDAMRAIGLKVEPARDRAAHLRRAMRWQRYRDGPLTAVHRACAADIARGALRAWAQTGGPP